MSTQFEYGEIYPTVENAKRVQNMTLVDLSAGGNLNSLEIANPNNESLVEDQRTRLQDNPELFKGSYDALGDLVGYIKVDDWKYALQNDFEIGVEKKLLFARKFLTRSHLLPRNPLGIMGLVADPRLKETYGQQGVSNMLGKLVDYAIDVSEQDATPRAIYISHYEDDPAIEATKSRNFFYTGKSGMSFGMQQHLYVRPAGTEAINMLLRFNK